jgi:hypothetical protein
MAAAWLQLDGAAGEGVSPEYVVDDLADLPGRPFPWR